MKTAIQLVCVMTLLASVGCNTSSSAPGAAPAAASSLPGPTLPGGPIDNKLALMSPSAIDCLHGQLISMQSQTSDSALIWSRIIGEKLYRAIMACTSITDADLTSNVSDDLFNLLSVAMTDGNGKVLTSIDSTAISTQLQKEYYVITKPAPTPVAPSTAKKK